MSIPAFDAWAIARILAGATLNGELSGVSGAFRPVAEHLNGLPAGDRSAAWSGYLQGTDVDRDAILRAVVESDPSGPAPEPSPEEEEEEAEWGRVQYSTLPPVDPFPLDVLPPLARGLAVALARAISCPVDFPAVATLAAASGAIGRSCSLMVKPNYFQSAALYLAFVGGASSGKSPSFRAANAPLWGISHRLKAEWDERMEEWERQDPKDRGRPPRMGRIISTEPTTEALGPILMSNPRGMMVAYDEMTRWVMSMDQYKGGKGGDRQFYLSAWGGEPTCVDRAKNMQEPIMVPHPFIAVAGGMVPAMLPSLAEGKGQEDGFMARLLFAFPDRVPKAYSEHGVPEEVVDDWRSIIDALHARPMLERDGMPAPRVVRFDDQARRDWVAWMHAHYAEQDTPDFPSRLEGAWGKLDAYAARLALVLHLMALAGDPAVGPEDEIPPIGRRGLDDAFRLVAYFKRHAFRVYAAIGGTDDLGCDKVNDHVRALIGWIVRNDLAEFSERDVDRNFDRFKDDPAALVEALGWLTKRQLIRPKPVAPKKGPGRKPGPAYLVNRAIRDDPRFRSP